MDDDRIAQLERRVEALEARLGIVGDGADEREERGRQLVEDARRRYASAMSTAPRRGSLKSLAERLTGEGAVLRIGSALLVLGVLFGVKYGIDRGWIVPEVRVAGAALLGTAALLVGAMLSGRRPAVSSALSGTGVAAWYLAVFSAQALYSIIPFAVGIVLMSAVTVLGALLASRRGHPWMAILAAAGGLATPFLLQSETAGVPGLVGYLSAVLAGASWLVLRFGWRSLFLFCAAASLPVAALVLTLMHDPDPVPTTHRVAVLVGLALSVVFFAVVPAVCTRADRHGPWMRGSHGAAGRLAGYAAAFVPAAVLPVAWGFAHVAWSMPHTAWGFAGLGYVAAITGALLALERAGHAEAALSVRLGQAWVLAFVFFEFAWSRPGFQLLAFAVAAWLVAADARRVGSDAPRRVAATLLPVILPWLAVRVLDGDGTGFSSPDSWADLATVSIVAIGGYAETTGRLRGLLAGVALAALVALCGREFTNPGTVTAAWSAIGVSVLVGGYRMRSSSVRLAGMAVLVLVVAKLLLIDLSGSDPLVRVGIFLGLGLALVGLGYLFPSWWKDPPRES